MLTKLRLGCILALFVSLFAFNSQLLSQVSLFSKKVTVDFKNQPVSTVLRNIEKQIGVKFSYDPTQINATKLIAIREINQPLGEVLVKIFNNPTIAFRQVGNQIVIFSLNEQPENNQTNNTDPDKKQVKPVVTDPVNTVYIYQRDTVTRLKTDTVFVKTPTFITDTVIKRDTVFIKEKKPAPARKPKEKESYFSIEPQFRFFPGKPSYTEQNDNPEILKQTRNAVTASLNNFSAGIHFGYTHKAMAAKIGANYLLHGEKFSYTRTETTGGFFDVDTVETYYSVSGTDTSWYYIKDSTYIPVESNKQTYSKNNSYRYIEIPLQLSYRILKNKNFSLWLNGSLSAGILMKADAIAFDPEDFNKIITVSENNLNPLIFSWQAGFTSRFRLGEKTCATLSLGYRSQPGSQFKDLGVDKRFNSVIAGYGIEFIF